MLRFKNACLWDRQSTIRFGRSKKADTVAKLRRHNSFELKDFEPTD